MIGMPVGVVIVTVQVGSDAGDGCGWRQCIRAAAHSPNQVSDT